MNPGTTFSETTLGATGLRVRRLGLAASYWPGRKAVHYALDHGVNYFFAYGWDRQMVRVLRDVPSSRRQEIVIATGAYNWIFRHGDIRRSLEKRLRQFRTDYIDVFQFLGVLKPEHLPPRVMDDLLRLRAEGKVRAIGISTARPQAGRAVGGSGNAGHADDPLQCRPPGRGTRHLSAACSGTTPPSSATRQPVGATCCGGPRPGRGSGRSLQRSSATALCFRTIMSTSA